MCNERFEPIEKLEELCSLLANQQIEIHKAPDNDTEYDYLDENSACITVLNPYSDSKMFIDINIEFTISYGTFHSHFYPNASEYEEMVKRIKALLNNEMCTASFYYGEDKKLLLSASLWKYDMNERITELINEHMPNLYGGKVECLFWNPADNRTIKIPENSRQE